MAAVSTLTPLEELLQREKSKVGHTHVDTIPPHCTTQSTPTAHLLSLLSSARHCSPLLGTATDDCSAQTDLTDSAERYIASHPQLPALINDFLTAWQAHNTHTHTHIHTRRTQLNHPLTSRVTSVCACSLLSLTFQPADVHAYARQYFSSFHPRANNRPVLDGDMAALLTARTPREPNSGNSSSSADKEGSRPTTAQQPPQ